MTITEDTKEHPFMHAYPIERGNTLDAKAVDSVIDFVRQSTGTTSTVRPKVWVVGHEHMQREAQRVPHYKTGHEVIGWFSPNYPDKVFISDHMKIREPRHAAILAHEVTHFYQNQAGDQRDIDSLEADADHHMRRYFDQHVRKTKSFKQFVSGR